MRILVSWLADIKAKHLLSYIKLLLKNYCIERVEGWGEEKCLRVEKGKKMKFDKNRSILV